MELYLVNKVEIELDICQFLLQGTSEEEIKHVHRYVCTRAWHAERLDMPELLMSLVNKEIRNFVRMSLRPDKNHTVKEQFRNWIASHQFENIDKVIVRFFNRSMIGIDLEDLTDEQHTLGNVNKEDWALKWQEQTYSLIKTDNHHGYRFYQNSIKELIDCIG